MGDLDTTGVKFVSQNFQGFLSDIAKATQSIINFGNMTQNRLAALQSLEKSVKSVSSAAAREAAANAKTASSYNRLQSEKERTTQATLRAKNEMLKMNAAAVQSGSAIRMLTTGFSNMFPRLSSLTTVIAGVATGISRTGKEAAGATAPVSGFKGALGGVLTVALGFLTRDVFNALTRGLRNFIGTMFEGATSAQKLQIRFENLAAAQIMSEQGTKDFDSAIKQAVAPASEMLNWINELSLKVPFSRDSIANTVGLALAMGFTAEETKSLALSLTDFTAGMALTSEHLERILYNFGQMKAAGKILGNELKDLARGGLVPINEVLLRTGEAMGYTGAELQKFTQNAVEMGGDVDLFIEKFKEVAEEKFPNAAERMGRSWDGVIQRAKNFITVIGGTNLLGPLLAKVAGNIADALDNIMSPAVSRGASIIGIALGQAFDSIVEGGRYFISTIKEIGQSFGFALPKVEMFAASIAVAAEYIGIGMKNIADFIKRNVDKFADDFTTAATNAIDWGWNIIVNLASGIVKAAASVLVQAMNFISRILEAWMGPGSPPRIAPDVDKWGLLTMTEFLKGFLQADFSILDTLQGSIKGALDALVGLGQLDKDVVGEYFSNLSLGLAKFIKDFKETGVIDTGFLDVLRSSTAEFGEEIVELTQRQIALAMATKAVEDAELRLKAAQEAVTRGRTAVRKGMQEYNALLRAGASKSVLDAKLKEINAQEKLVAEAVKEEEASKVALENAKESQDVAKESASIQEDLVKQLIELARAQAIPVESEAGGGGGAGGGETEREPLGIPDIEAPTGGGVTLDFTAALDAAKEAIKKKLAEIRELFLTWLDDTLGPGWREKISAAWNAFTAVVVRWWHEGVKPILNSLVLWWDENGGPFIDKIGRLFELIGIIISTAFGIILTALNNLSISLTGESLTWEKVWDFISGAVLFAGSLIAAAIALVAAIVTGVINGISVAVGVFAGLWPGAAKAVKDFVFTLKNFLTSLKNFIKVLFTKDVPGYGDRLKDAWMKLWTDIKQFLAATWDAIVNVFVLVFATIVGLVAGFVQGVIDFFVGLYNALIGQSIVTDMMNEINDLIRDVLDKLLEWWNGIWDDLGEKVEDIKDGIVQFVTDLAEGIETKFGEAKGFIDDLKEKLVDFIDNVLTKLTGGLNSAKDAFNNIVTAIGDFLKKILSGDFKGALDLLWGLLGSSPSPLAIGLQTASKAMKEMTANALPGFAANMEMALAPLVTAQSLQSSLVGAPATISAPPAIRGQSISFGDTNIYSDMDAALFQARVLQIVRNENV